MTKHRISDHTSELERLRRENEELKKQRLHGGQISFRVSEKGCLSLYGLGRWPLSLYYGQWKTLLEHANVIHEQLELNKSKLKMRD